MNCPIDNTELRLAERQGIEIDYCPKCRGVWLDRGELDKLIERSMQSGFGGTRDSSDYDRERYDDRPSRHTSDHDKRGRRRSFLGDLFEFD